MYSTTTTGSSASFTLKMLDPWAEEWVTPEELRARCFRYAKQAESRRYRLRRLWHWVRTGVWLPDARDFERRAWVQWS